MLQQSATGPQSAASNPITISEDLSQLQSPVLNGVVIIPTLTKSVVIAKERKESKAERIKRIRIQILEVQKKLIELIMIYIKLLKSQLMDLER